MRSCSPPVKRARPLLGTFVTVSVDGLEPDVANLAISECFDRIAHIHRCMSFQAADSDVSRLNRDAYRTPVRVDDDTCCVLGQAADLAVHSGGVFDVTASPSLSRALRSHHRGGFAPPDPDGGWSDIELLPDQFVRFRRPVLIDLSGIAKGYAVDQALAVLQAYEPREACVNAGGDLAQSGAEGTLVRLHVPLGTQAHLPLVEIRNGALASSGPRNDFNATTELEFVDGAARRVVRPRFVSVIASTCAVADALTKVVMALGMESAEVLRHYAARALLNVQPSLWHEVG